MDTFGSEVSNYTYKKILAELVWVRYDNNSNNNINISHCFPDMSSKLVRFLGEILNTNSRRPEFEPASNQLTCTRLYRPCCVSLALKPSGVDS